MAIIVASCALVASPGCFSKMALVPVRLCGI